MRTNRVKQTLQEGGRALGTFLFEFSSPGIPGIVRAAQADFMLIDMEHTGWGFETVRRLIVGTPAPELVPIVRVPATEYHFIARALDMGAMGVMVPMVESAQQARKIAECALYPPAGRRGAAFGIGHDHYEAGDLQEKIRQANSQLMIIAQIETASGLEHVEEIAEVPGIDVLWVGQTDLTCSLGIPGQFSSPQFLEALDRVAEAATRHQKVAGYMPLTLHDARGALARGYRMIAYSGDVWLYQQALQQGLEELRHRS